MGKFYSMYKIFGGLLKINALFSRPWVFAQNFVDFSTLIAKTHSSSNGLSF